MRKPLLTIGVVLALSGLVPGADKPADPKAARFEDLLQKVQSNPGGTKESEVMELLELSRELGRPYSASLSIRGYLSHNYQPSPELLLATADAAYRAGDYTFAVARFKAYLAAARPSKEVGRAAGTLCSLLVDFLGAEEDAYQFLRKHCEKFRQDPGAQVRLVVPHPCPRPKRLRRRCEDALGGDGRQDAGRAGAAVLLVLPRLADG